jgi:hypothetical protein
VIDGGSQERRMRRDRAAAPDEQLLNPTFIFNSASEAQVENVRTTMSRTTPLHEGNAMINKYIAMGLGALIAIAPVVASVDAAQAATAKTSTHKTHKSKTHKTKSHHTAKKKTAPAEAPKS